MKKSLDYWVTGESIRILEQLRSKATFRNFFVNIFIQIKALSITLSYWSYVRRYDNDPLLPVFEL